MARHPAVTPTKAAPTAFPASSVTPQGSWCSWRSAKAAVWGIATAWGSRGCQAGIVSLRRLPGKRWIRMESKFPGWSPRPVSMASVQPVPEVRRRVGRLSTPRRATWRSPGAARKSLPARRSMIRVVSPAFSRAAATRRVLGTPSDPPQDAGAVVGGRGAVGVLQDSLDAGGVGIGEPGDHPGAGLAEVAESDEPPGGRGVGEAGAVVVVISARVPQVQGDVPVSMAASLPGAEGTAPKASLTPSAAAAIGARTQAVPAVSPGRPAGATLAVHPRHEARTAARCFPGGTGVPGPRSSMGQACFHQ